MKAEMPSVLVVDDSPKIVDLLVNTLKDDYRLEIAESGPQALDYAKKYNPDLILLDIMMPEMDGFETCRRLKQEERTRDIPIIFLSSLTDSKTKVTCFEIGGVDFINKPFEAREVLARVQTHITLKQQERQLRGYTKKLEQIIEERTRQLIHADRLSTIGTFSAGIAHEIRNPLTGINTYLYNLEELFDSADSLDPDGIKMAQEIVSQLQIASGKIEAVIKRVLDFSKPIVPKMSPVNINHSIEEAVKLASSTLRKGGINLERSLADNMPHCYADPILVEQVMLNLLNNAARAMKMRTGTKMIEIISSVQNGHVVVQVSDSGPGVPEEIRDRIFDPFFTTNADGSGIGLNLVQRIITDHRGAIDVTTGKWGGAEFKFQLPIEKRRNPR